MSNNLMLSHSETFPEMLPLSCACLRAHTGREMSAHKKTWSTHKCSLQNNFCTVFHTHHSKEIYVHRL